jgi:hypothetical protein
MSLKPIWVVIDNRIVRFGKIADCMKRLGMTQSTIYTYRLRARQEGKHEFTINGIRFFTADPGNILNEPGDKLIDLFRRIDHRHAGLLPGLCTRRQGVYRGQRV